MDHLREQVITPPTIACSNCNASILVVPKMTPLKYSADLFGDEAYREVNDEQWFVYAMVGAVDDRMPVVEDRVRALKTSLEPSRDPSSWRFHMKAIHSGDHRKKHEVFSAWSRETCTRAVDGLFAVLREEPTLLRYCITVREANVESAKRRAFQALLIYAMDSLSRAGVRGRFRFDTERPELTDGVQGWVQELFAEIQGTVLYLFLSRALEFAHPLLVEPGAHPCSELADFLAFVVARRHHDVAGAGRTAETYSTEKAGKVMWARFDADGNLVVEPRVGYSDESLASAGTA